MSEGCKNQNSPHTEIKNKAKSNSAEIKSLSQLFPGEQFGLSKLANSSAVSNEFVQMGSSHV